MDFNSDKASFLKLKFNNEIPSKPLMFQRFISTITDFIPEFSPNGVLLKENEEKSRQDIFEVLIQSET